MAIYGFCENKCKHDINDLITTETIEIPDITVESNTTCQVGQPVVKEGYEALGIIMCDLTNNQLLFAKHSIVEGMAYINLANYSGSSQTTKVIIRVLYEKL